MEIAKQIRKCKKCNINLHKPLVFGNPEKAKFVFISEEPTEKARDNDFVSHYLGEADQRFHSEWMPNMGIDNDWIRKNIKNENLYITHTIKCCSEITKKTERDLIVLPCINWFEQEKKMFQNALIITFGSYAFFAITGILPKKGFIKKFKENSVYKVGGNTILPMLHPSKAGIKYLQENHSLINERLGIIKQEIRQILGNKH